jgi:hypothetical protein
MWIMKKVFPMRRIVSGETFYFHGQWYVCKRVIRKVFIDEDYPCLHGSEYLGYEYTWGVEIDYDTASPSEKAAAIENERLISLEHDYAVLDHITGADRDVD